MRREKLPPRGLIRAQGVYQNPGKRILGRSMPDSRAVTFKRGKQPTYGDPAGRKQDSLLLPLSNVLSVPPIHQPQPRSQKAKRSP